MPKVSERGSVLLKMVDSVIVICVLCACIGTAAITFKQQATGTGTKKTTAVTIAAPTGTSFLAANCGVDGNANLSSISETNATWASVVDTEPVGANTDWQWIALNVPSSGGTSITVNWTGNIVSACNVAEWTGIDTLSATDGTNNNNGSGTSASSNSITTTVANDLVLCSVTYESTSAPTSQPSGFTTMTRASSSPISMQSNYQIVSATGTYSCAWTLPSSVDWTAVIAAYKCTSACGGAVTPKGLLLRGVGFAVFRYFWWWR